MSGSSASKSQGRNSSRSNGESTGRSRAKTSSRTSGTSHSESVSEGESWGTSTSHSVSEGLEPVYENLPSAVHGMENMLYFAAQSLRSLKTGEAYAHYAGVEGIAATRVLVPRVRTVVRTDAQYAAIRTAILERSAAALPAVEAEASMEARQQALFEHSFKNAVPEEPESFRTPRLPSPAHGRPVLASPNAVKGDNRQRRRPAGRL